MRNILYASLLVIAITFAACSGTSKQDDLTVIKNVKGYTFHNDSLDTFSALAFKDGKIVDVAFDGHLQADTTGARIIDGGGRVMLPGLTDAHGHVMELGFQELQINVAGISSLDSTLQRIKEYAANNPDLTWIQGRGWNQTHWKANRFPTAKELDQVVNDRPVWLSRVDGHAAWANSKAMEIAGITAQTKDPDGGKIIRDKKGNPTGVFVDGATGLVAKYLPMPTKKEREMALEKALAKMRSKGMTEVHHAGIYGPTWRLYKQFADSGKLTTRIYAMIRGTDANFDSLSANGPINSYDNDMLALRSVKLYADGALGSRGAAMLEPYSDDPGNTGLLFHTQKELNRMVLKANAKGYQVNIHAIGDRANREVLNAFETSWDSLGDQGLRNRVEHAQVVSLKDIPRFKKYHVIASMQPTHATSDMNMAEDRIGAQRMKGAYAWRTFLDQGTVVPFGSDFPVEHVNPFYGLYSAVTRQDHQGNPPGGWYPGQKVTRKEALRAFTLDAAYAAHQEDVLGSLEKGKWADFIFIDRDYFTVPAIQIWQTKVLQTWVAGEKVYDSTDS